MLYHRSIGTDVSKDRNSFIPKLTQSKNKVGKYLPADMAQHQRRFNFKIVSPLYSPSFFANNCGNITRQAMYV
jgi:hypothetical protein